MEIKRVVVGMVFSESRLGLHGGYVSESPARRYPPVLVITTQEDEIVDG